MKKIILFILTILLLSGCNRWQGFYYPNGCLSCVNDYIFSPTYEDMESCLAWAEDMKRVRGNPNDTFECGKNCKPPASEYDLYVCEETVD